MVMTSPGCCEAQRDDIPKLPLPHSARNIEDAQKVLALHFITIITSTVIITSGLYINFQRIQNTPPHLLIANIKCNIFVKLSEGERGKRCYRTCLQINHFQLLGICFPLNLTQTQKELGGYIMSHNSH